MNTLNSFFVDETLPEDLRSRALSSVQFVRSSASAVNRDGLSGVEAGGCSCGIMGHVVVMVVAVTTLLVVYKVLFSR